MQRCVYLCHDEDAVFRGMAALDKSANLPYVLACKGSSAVCMFVCLYVHMWKASQTLSNGGSRLYALRAGERL